MSSRHLAPAGIGALFSIQVFSALSFSVFYSTLILYATNGMHMSDSLAASLTGSFIALNYFLHLLGGYLGGRFFSHRSLFMLSMALLILGCVLFSIPDPAYFYWGLALFVTGNGLNAICTNCMVTQLFEPEDKRRETVFLWIYSGMNMGFFIGFMISGYFHLHHAYQPLFLLSALSNIVALVLMTCHWKLFKDRDTSFLNLRPTQKQHYRLFGIMLILSLMLLLRGLFQQTLLCHLFILITGSAMIVLLTKLSFHQPSEQAKHKLWAFIILSLASIVFWVLYFLVPLSFNLFIERNVDRHYFDILIAPQWIQNINTIMMIIGAPVLGLVFIRLRKLGININIPLQFAFALFLIGVAFAILPIGIHYANQDGLVNFNWIACSYLLQSLGELFISPIGFAMIGELAPLPLRGVMMGMWLMLSGMAAILSNHFSQLALNSDSLDPLMTNLGYSHSFMTLGLSAIGASVILLLLVPLLTRLMQDNSHKLNTSIPQPPAVSCP